MKRLALLLVLLASPAIATQEYLLPTLFDVTGVAEDDVLNIRARPDAGAELLGTFAPGATGIEVVEHDPSGDWGRVNAGEVSGWVAMRFLAYRTDVWEENALPAGLRCLGTEPFWSLSPEAGRLMFEEPDGPVQSFAIEAVLSSGVFRDPRRAVLAGETGARLTATIAPTLCSDGMSDRVYGLSLMGILERGSEPRMLSGCCALAR